MANGLLLRPLTPVSISAAGATEAGFGPASLIAPQPRDFTESLTADLSLDIDLGAAVTADSVGVIATNAGLDATWSIRAAAAQGGLDLAGDLFVGAFPGGSDAPAGGPIHAFSKFAAATERWWRVSISGGTVAGGRLRAGVLVLGLAFQPVWNFELGRRQSRLAPGDDTVSDGGALFPAARLSRRLLQLRWSDLTDDEAHIGLAPIEQAAAEGTPILFIRDPDPAAPFRHTGILYGRLIIPQGTEKRHNNEWRAQASIEEMT